MSVFVDSHTHLDASRFDDDRPTVIRRAREAGVRQLLSVACLGSGPRAGHALLEMTRGDQDIFVAAGVHPHDAGRWSPDLETELREVLQHPRVVALGEIGLDFYYDNSPRDLQQRAFERQVEIAREVDRPVVIHTRSAWDETIRVLAEVYDGLAADRGVFHCFGGDRQQADQCLALGFLVGLGGILTFKKSEPLRRLAAALPATALLLETDAPYLAPVPHRGKRNEPAFVTLVAQELARCRDTTPAEIGRLTTANFHRLMRLGGEGPAAAHES